MVRNARVVDGACGPAFLGDVVVKDGLISAIDVVVGGAAREIDAKGHIGAPGLIDIDAVS